MKRQYVAYIGEEFTIEWYYKPNGRSPAYEYFLELDDQRKNKVKALWRLMGDAGEIRNEEKFRNEGDKIFAFKPQPDRFLCFFFVGKKIIMTNAFEKKERKLPSNEKEKALMYHQDYIDRVKKGIYYE